MSSSERIWFELAEYEKGQEFSSGPSGPVVMALREGGYMHLQLNSEFTAPEGKHETQEAARAF